METGDWQSTQGKYHCIFAMFLYFSCKHLLLATVRDRTVLWCTFFLTECVHPYILNQTWWKCLIMIKMGLGMGWGSLKFGMAAFHPWACHKSWCIAQCSTTSTTKQMSFLVWDFIAELALSSADTILMVNELQGRLHLMQDSSHYSSWHWQNDRVVK